MNDSTRRAIRTCFDLVPGIVAALLVMVPVLGLPATKVAAITGFLGALVVAFAKLRNALEDANVIPAFLKAPASSGANPVPDPGPARDQRTGRFISDDGVITDPGVLVIVLVAFAIVLVVVLL